MAIGLKYMPTRMTASIRRLVLVAPAGLRWDGKPRREGGALRTTTILLLLAVGGLGFAGGWFGRQARHPEKHCYVVAGAVTVRTDHFRRYQYQDFFGSRYAPPELVCA